MPVWGPICRRFLSETARSRGWLALPAALPPRYSAPPAARSCDGEGGAAGSLTRRLAARPAAAAADPPRRPADRRLPRLAGPDLREVRRHPAALVRRTLHAAPGPRRLAFGIARPPRGRRRSQ